MPKLPETWRDDVIRQIQQVPGEKKLTVADIARKYGVKYNTASAWKRKIKTEMLLRKRLGQPPLLPSPALTKTQMRYSINASKERNRPDPIVREKPPRILDKPLRELIEDLGGDVLSTKELLSIVSALAQHGAPNIQLAAVKQLDELKRAYAPEEERGPGRPRSYEQRVERLKVILDAVGEKATRAALEAIHPSLLRTDSQSLEHPVQPDEKPADEQASQTSSDADCHQAQPVHPKPPSPSPPEPEAEPCSPPEYPRSSPAPDEEPDEAPPHPAFSPAEPPGPEQSNPF